MSADNTHGAKYIEPHSDSVNSRLNWLRAGVLGANDGIVSVAGLLMGVAATGADSHALLIAGVAAVASGAVSMALGEYVSVSAQRDTEQRLVAKERWELENFPEDEHLELVSILRSKGLSEAVAEQAVREMEQHDRLAAHLDLELGMAEDDYTNPWVAAGSSAVSFVVGAFIPLLVCMLVPDYMRVWATLIGTLIALGVTGGLSAVFSGGSRSRSVARLAVGGALALAVTYAIGWVFGVSVA
ncbi:VIT1/CCC1 transporter family protein [Corynebacterium epidermidicanis]|nr:VIT family protein [Corynebacterium epidermidicanis]